MKLKELRRCRRHSASAPDLRLTAAFRTRYRGIGFDEITEKPRCFKGMNDLFIGEMIFSC